MRNHSMRTTDAPARGDDAARRRLFGLAALVLTLSAGYALANRGTMPAALVQFAADADAAEEDADAEEESEARPATAPTTAEIMAHIEEVAARHRVSPKLVAAIVAVESEFNPRAVSRRGAQGLMQLMPATAASLDVQDSFDMHENLDGGVRHLRILMGRFHNDLPLVLAAYNAGDRAVIAYGGVPPYPQTRRYVVRVLRRYDPVAAKAASVRIYGPPHTVTPKPQVITLDWPPPPARPVALGPWRESAAARADVPPPAPPHAPSHGTNSP
jgi:soluble lytic murein transglycosylase-like protein